MSELLFLFRGEIWLILRYDVRFTPSTKYRLPPLEFQAPRGCVCVVHGDYMQKRDVIILSIIIHVWLKFFSIRGNWLALKGQYMSIKDTQSSSKVHFKRKQPETKDCCHRCTENHCRFVSIRLMFIIFLKIFYLWKDQKLSGGQNCNCLWHSSKPKMMDYKCFCFLLTLSHWRRNIVLFFRELEVFLRVMYVP